MKGIRFIESGEPLNTSVEIIRKSFGTVAEELNLTPENAPTHPSFITLDQLEELLKKGLVFYGYFMDDRQVGFVAIEKADENLYYMEKLAVLPEYRHKGYGGELVRFVLDTATAEGAKKLSIGIIHEQTVLKDWYQDIGFRETGTRKFEHLPFTVGFMEIDLV
ncbi:MAG: GNAT family N-acetyltransferase [Dehalococcoidales bacterium]|nr:MAG: GNAT family N-acetyltransferase [Dehalococcoidales bacterium]